MGTPSWVTVTTLLGLVIAGVAWAAMFALGRDGFWRRATLAGLAIGVYALVAQRRRLSGLFVLSAVEVGIGAVSGVALYAVFWIGDRLLRRLFPSFAAEVSALYAVRAETQPATMPLVLCVIGPAEELFWRGLVQARAGVLVMLVAYGAVHLWERKAILIVAAIVGGAWWGALFAWRGTLVAPIVSHLLWDLMIIVWFPVRPKPIRHS